MKRKIFTFALVCLMAINFLCLTISASDFEVTPYRWDNIREVKCELKFIGTTGYITARVNGESGTTHIEGTVKLYRKDSNGNWQYDNKSWSDNTTSQTLSITNSFTGTSGVEYKAVLSASVTIDGYAEPVSKDSIATCP